MADMTRIKGRIQEVIRPNGVGAITAAEHQSLLLEMVDDINTKKADQSELIATQESLDALEQKVDNLPQGGGDFDAEGNYPLLHVGTADDLAGRGESVPAEFGFRASGGKSIKDGRAYIKRIKGNSVVWNQLIQRTYKTTTHNGVTFTVNEDGSIVANGTATAFAYLTVKRISVNAAHKYCVIGGVDNASSTIYYFGDGNNLNLYNTKYIIANPINNATVTFACRVMQGVTVENIKFDIPKVFDLTQMFGAGNEPTTIEEFNARVATLGVDLNAYNEGEVIHMNTESIKSVGDNAWDEEWEVGNISPNGENFGSSTDMIRSKNYIPVLPSEEYVIVTPTTNANIFFYDEQQGFISTIIKSSASPLTIPNNCHYMRFVVGSSASPYPAYNHDIMITLVHSGWKQDTDAGYQPYWQDILPLPIIRKYFPEGMKSAGSAHDEIRLNKASGKWEYSKGKIKSVDLGTLNWKNLDASNGMFYLNAQEIAALNMAKSTNTEAPTNLMSSLYRSAPTFEITNIDKVFRGPFTTAYSGYLTVKDTSYTDAASFKAAMAGVILYYESNDWEWVELDAEDQNFRDYYQVADFGTEQAISTTPSAPFSADIIYQFNAVDMIREHEIEITELQSILAPMQAQLTALTNGGQ